MNGTFCSINAAAVDAAAVDAAAVLIEGGMF